MHHSAATTSCTTGPNWCVWVPSAVWKWAQFVLHIKGPLEDVHFHSSPFFPRWQPMFFSCILATKNCSMLTYYLVVGTSYPLYCMSCIANSYVCYLLYFSFWKCQRSTFLLSVWQSILRRSTKLEKHLNPVKQEGKRHTKEAGRRPNLLCAVSWRWSGWNIPTLTQWHKCHKTNMCVFSATFQNETTKPYIRTSAWVDRL